MKKIITLSAGLIISLAGIAVASADSMPNSTSPAEAAINAPTPAPAPTPMDTNKCTMKTDLPADMVTKCTQAIANNDQAMLEGCCQEGGK